KRTRNPYRPNAYWIPGSRPTAAPGITMGVRGILRAQPLDLGTAGAELGLELLEAAVEMIDAVDGGLAFGGERRDHQRYRGAQIGRHHRRAAQARDAVDRRSIAIQANARAEP